MAGWVQQLTRVFPAPDTYNVSMLLFRVAVSAHLMLTPIEVGPMGGELPWLAAELLRGAVIGLATVLLPLLVMVGLFSRLASAGILTVLLVYGLVVGWTTQPLPYLYGITYLQLLVLGPGKYSADYLIHRSLTRW